MEITMQEHSAWLANHYAANPPLRLAEPAGYEGEPTYVDTIFVQAIADQLYTPPVKRGRGRPRKYPIKG